MSKLDEVLNGMLLAGYNATLEHPGFICAPLNNGSTLNFGFTNGTFGYTLVSGQETMFTEECENTSESTPSYNLGRWAIEKIEDHGEHVDTTKTAFIVMVLGYWGRGKTVKEAALKCKEQGAKRTDRTVVYFFIGDDKPEVNDMGSTLRVAGSESFLIAKGLQLCRLTQLED